MDCAEISYSGHAVRRMFERRLDTTDAEAVIRGGEVIMDYPDDKPFPSKLYLGHVGATPIHVVVAYEVAPRRCHVVTTYVPNTVLWSEDLKARRQP